MTKSVPEPTFEILNVLWDNIGLMVTTTWEYNLENEGKRLVHCAHQIVVGFYKANDIPVLPYSGKPQLQSAAIFPDLPYKNIKRFWEISRKTNVYTLPIPLEKNVEIILTEFLKDIPTPRFQKTQLVWEKASNEVISEIYMLLPSKINAIKKITIYPTTLGTTCSVNWPAKFPAEFILYLREDQGIWAITEMLLTALTRSDVYNDLQGSWSESEMIVDFLLTQTSLKKVLEKYEGMDKFFPTVKTLRDKQKGKLLKESEKFYQKLGIAFDRQLFELKNDTVHILGKPAVNLSQKEQLLLKSLIEKKGGILTFDEAGDLIFQNEDNFSLWAIAKTLQRVRDKLEANGISGSFIQTVRNEGYYLKS